jgi:hypothetical protein
VTGAAVYGTTQVRVTLTEPWSVTVTVFGVVHGRSLPLLAGLPLLTSTTAGDRPLTW